MHSRSTAWPRALVLCVAVCALASTMRAEEFLGLPMHGFGGWYYGRSNGPQFVEAQKGGNAQTAQLALNLSAKPADRFNIVTQVNLAQNREGGKVVLDYAFIDYDLISRVKPRAGRAKHVRAIGRSLKTLREAGVRVALDDIGARYAWLHHMLWLEPDFLKLDRSFVRGAARSPLRSDLIAGVVAFAGSSGAAVIAEGIETASERDAMQRAGVALGQGFLLGVPKSAQEWFPFESIGVERTRVAGLFE